MTSGSRKRWELTQEAFDDLLAWLHPNREQAAKKYEDIRGRLIRIFLHRGCTTAEDLADKTINQIARKAREIKERYEGDPALYFYGAARNIYNDYYNNRPDEGLIAAETLPVKQVEDHDESEHEHRCLEECLNHLPRLDRELLLDYYREDGGTKIEHHKDMASRRGISVNALRIVVCRLRNRFKQCMHECLQSEAA